MEGLSPQKRTQLIMLALVTGGIIAAIIFFLVLPLRASLRTKKDAVVDAHTRLDRARRSLAMSETIKSDLLDASHKLQAAETGVARGDIYRWIVNVLLGFSDSFNIEFNNIEQPAIGDPVLAVKVPYKVATFTVTGTSTYHDFGRFLAEFERRYPLITCQSLELEPTTYVETDPDLPGKLNFKMGLTALVKPRGQ